MSMTRNDRRFAEAGQALVIMTLAMVAALAMVALIVDGGNAWVQQRNTQNGADAAANAGATMLGQRLKGDTILDSQVATAIAQSAAANFITVPHAYYTDMCGVGLKLDGTAASDQVNYTDAAEVGGGSLPAEYLPDLPSCPSASVGPVRGVVTLGEHQFGTFIAPIIGINTLTASTRATAVSGYLQTGNMLPIAFNEAVTSCDNEGNAVVSAGTTYPTYTRLVLPICKVGSGNVGFIDFSPPNGGINELVACSQTPCDSPVTLPVWVDIAQPGGTSSKPLEDALNQHDGEVVLLPMFAGTCTGQPSDPTAVNTVTPFGCTAPETFNDLNGQNAWYRLTSVGAFELEHAYLNGSNVAECNPPWSDPQLYPSSDCLIGQFVDFITDGTVGSGISFYGSTKAIGVQLIK